MQDFLQSILREDTGRGDLFSKIFHDIPKEAFSSERQIVKAHIIAKQRGIFSGEIYVKKLCELEHIEALFYKHDRESFEPKEVLLELCGQYLEILKIERSLLNILQHSSGIATFTNEYVKAIEKYNITLLDTRKTRPLLREFEKYSVRNGGARNHRYGLDTMLMLKDTHLEHIKDITLFVKYARNALPFGTAIEIECQNIKNIKEALYANVDIIMCDNMDIDTIKKSIELKNKISPHTLIEISGNITLDNIVEYAKTGADVLSCGSIIHQAKWLDMSMNMLK